ncbi:MAG: S-layer homology domain-containing protein [Bifidobacteriaceae bacterium]|jgi:hypothetical protein|nr:S-layer homology domain-containing protein [Bifidobacteriaceae bacterium]
MRKFFEKNFLLIAGLFLSLCFSALIPFSDKALAFSQNMVKISYNNLSKKKYDFRFQDVPLGNTARDDIIWAYQYGIVNGYTATSYMPGSNLTRAQMAIFIYNVAGKPDFTPQNNPFRDIDPSTVGYREILWLSQNNITTGVTSNHYGPNIKVTRNQMALFLYRLGGMDRTTTTCGFSDIAKLSTEAKYAICYLKDKGVTTGTTSTTYSPSQKVTRNQMAMFIHRASVNILINEVPDTANKAISPILLGAFFSSENNPFDIYLYTSQDGIHFEDPINPTFGNANDEAGRTEQKQSLKVFTSRQEQILKNFSEKYNGNKAGEKTLNHSLTYSPINFRDPSIIFDESSKYFYMVGTLGRVNNSLGFWLSCSHDLRTWSDPKAVINLQIPSGIPVFPNKDVDSWAPEFYQENGEIYILLSAGNSETYMEPVLTKCLFFPQSSPSVSVSASCQAPYKVNIPGATGSNSSNCNLSTNYRGKIDGQITKRGNSYYLTDKPNGHCPNELFSSQYIGGPYTRINNNITDSNKFGRHGNSGDSLYKTLEGTTHIFYQNKFFAYSDNFYDVGDGRFDGNMQYVISGSEKFNFATVPQQLMGPRKMRHGQVTSFDSKDMESYLAVYNLRNGTNLVYNDSLSANTGLGLYVTPLSSRPDNKSIQNTTTPIKISIYNYSLLKAGRQTIKYWDSQKNSKIIKTSEIDPGHSQSFQIYVLTSSISHSYQGKVCFYNEEQGVCDSESLDTSGISYFVSSIIKNNFNLGVLGTVWAENAGNRKIVVTIPGLSSDTGWPVLQYKVELERYKKSTLVQYVSSDAETVTFSNLSKGETYWPKVTALTSFGTSPRHVRSCGYGSKANCDTGITI